MAMAKKSNQTFKSMFDEFTFSDLRGSMLIDAIAENKGLVKWLYERDIIEIDDKIQKNFDKEMGYEQ